jgi:hypothetical protein
MKDLFLYGTGMILTMVLLMLFFKALELVGCCIIWGG